MNVLNRSHAYKYLVRLAQIIGTYSRLQSMLLERVPGKLHPRIPPLLAPILPPCLSQALANTWRTTGDISNNWRSIVSTAKANNGHRMHAGPGGFNDPGERDRGSEGSRARDVRG